MAGWLLDDVIKWLLAKAVVASLNALWGLLATTVFVTPDVTVLPQVAAITSKSQTVVNVVFVLAIITAGITVMTHESFQVRYGIGDLAPRLVVGFVASNFATPLCKNLIELANALTRALTGEGVGSQDTFAHLLRVITDTMQDPQNAFLLAVIGLILAALTAMLLVTWLVRLGTLIVLVGIAPIALACHATPYTDGAARLWWRSVLGLLGTVLLQALALHTTLDIFLRPDANLSALGLPQDHTGLLNLFIIICLLWIVIKIPALVRRYVMGGGGQNNVAGLLVRMVLVQQLTRIFRSPVGRGGRTAAAAGAARGAGRTTGGPSVAGTVIPYWRPRLARPTPAASSTATPAAGASAAPPARRPRVRIPVGVTPATAMPKTRPAWQNAGRPAPAPPVRPGVPAGVTPGTAMPQRRPAWRAAPAAATTPPAASGGPPARPRVPRGVNPATAMPHRKPSWRRS